MLCKKLIQFDLVTGMPFQPRGSQIINMSRTTTKSALLLCICSPQWEGQKNNRGVSTSHITKLLMDVVLPTQTSSFQNKEVL